MKFAINSFHRANFQHFHLDRGGPVYSAGPGKMTRKNIGQILILCHTYIYCVGVWEKGLEGLLRRVRAAPPGIMAQKCSGF